MQINRIRISLAVLICLFMHTAHAQDGLSLQEASQRALNKHPELQLYEWQLQAIDGMQKTASLKPGFELGFEAENIAGTGEFANINGAQYTLAISSVIELGDQRQARVAVAGSHEALVQIERKAKALDLVGRVTQRFISALSVQEKLKVASEAVELAESLTNTVAARVEMGAVPDAERLRAKATLAQAKLRWSSLETELVSRKVALSTLWNEEGTMDEALIGNLYEFKPAVNFEQLYRQASKSPEIAVFSGQARLRDAELELARSQNHNNIRWSLGVRHNEQVNDSALTAMVNIPLFTERRNQGQVQTALAQRAITDQRRQIAIRELRARVFEAWATYKQSAAAVAQYKSSVLPALENALQQTQDAYKRGRYRYVDLVNAQQQLIDARFAIIEAATTALLNQALIEQLTGQSMNASTVFKKNVRSQ